MTLSLKHLTTTIALVGLSAAALGVAGAAEKRYTLTTTPDRPGVTQAVKDTLASPPTRVTPRATTMDPTTFGPLTGFAPVKELPPVHFAFDRATLRPADMAIVDASVEWLRMHPTEKLLVEGYADERGDVRYNMDLADRRARALRDALIARGVPASRFITASYGAARPACRARTEACWRESRTAILLVEPARPQSP